MNTENKTKWYYIIMQNPGAGGEQILGYEHPETQKPFIPAFSAKEKAQTCFMVMPKDLMKENYEAQAIIKEDLLSLAAQEGHLVYLLDESGKILDQIT